jgi:hypothetical protein
MSLTFHRTFALTTGSHGRKRLADPDAERVPTPETAGPPPGRVPRITRLMALAIKFDGYLQAGVVHDYAELARLGHVSRARVTQIMDLTLLAPEIQEALLTLPRTQRGRDPIRELRVRPIAATPDWREQRRMWGQLVEEHGPTAVDG